MEVNLACVGLRKRVKVVYLFGFLPSAQQKNAGSKRVKGASVTNFDASDGSSDVFHGVE
jgi:hypothetical protein